MDWQAIWLTVRLAAVVSAIHQAAGVRLRELPATPERVWDAIRAQPPSPEAPRG